MVALLAVGCKSTKYVPSGKFLVSKVKIVTTNKKLNQSELLSCIRQNPNRKVLGMRFYLGLYNMSNIKKNKGINKQLREMGEEPVVYDPVSTQMSVNQLKNYLFSKGFLNAEVTDTVILKKRKALVVYRFFPNTQYVIRSLKYSFEDTCIRNIFFKDTGAIVSNIKAWRKGPFDLDILNKERGNIEYYMRNNGYYRFSRDMVTFDADTSSNQVDLVLNVSNEVMKTPTGQLITIPHKQYKIKEITILTEGDQTGKKRNVEVKNDTIIKYGVKFIYQNNFWVKPNIIQQSNYIMPGEFFRISDVEQTKAHLASLNVFNVVNTNQFKELPATDTAKYYYLDCLIKLSPSSIQGFDLGLVGTNSWGNFGVATTATYQHRSLFGNAENLSLKFKWALEAVQRQSSNQIDKALEYGIESTLNIPKFLIPFNSMAFRKRYNPKTYFTLAYNYLDRPDFKNTSATVSFGYNWKGATYKTHLVTPVNINYINYSYIDPNIKEKFSSNSYLKNLYTSHVVTSTSYTYRFDNQDYKRRSDYRYFQANVEFAGNILSLYNSLAKARKDSTSSYYSLWGLRYSQYVRTEFDFHYFHAINAYMGTAYRLYAGIGIPYGNATSLPFERQFFSGGANSIRGWQVRSLGPGSYVERDTNLLKYPNSTGDIKLEGNIEHRFKLFWYLEGAIFAEAGNIWLLPSNRIEKPSEAIFKFSEFYKQLAFGSGFGIRLNYTYFIIRLDLGLKVRDPARQQWVYDYGKLSWRRDFALSFAIGYPF